MNEPFLQIWNNHTEACGTPPPISNRAHDRYCGYFQNRHGEQWVFQYDHEQKVGELRGGDLGWDQVIVVNDGQVDVMLGKAEAAWLQACWKAATFAG